MDQLAGNAFVVTNKYTYLDYVKFVVFFIPAVLRLIVFTFFMLLCGISSHILYFIRNYIHRPKEYLEWKKHYIYIPKLMIRCAIFCMGFYKINIIDQSNSKEVNIENKKTETDKKQHPILLLTPHSSIFDYFAVVMLGLPPFVARFQVKQNRFISKLAALGEPIIVVREERASCKNTIEVIKDRAKEEQILLFPEGTNSNRQMIIRYRLGAFIPGLPVQPIFIKFNNYTIDSYSWTWEGPNYYTGFLLTCLKWKSSMTLIKLPVYYPNEEEKQNAAFYSQNVQKYVTQQMNVRLSFYTYDDVQFLKLANTAGIPRSPIGLKFLKLCRRINQCMKNTVERLEEKRDVIVTNGNNGFRRPGGLKRTASSLSLEGISENFWEETDFNIIQTMNELTSKFIENEMNTNAKPMHITSTNDLMRLLSLQQIKSQLEQSSVIDDVYSTLRGQENNDITTNELTILMMLCDTRIYHFWDRIKEIFLFLNKRDAEHLCNCVLSIPQFKTLVWYLLGIEAAVIDYKIFQHNSVTFDFVHNNLVRFFKRAVEENASDLINS